MSAVEEGACGPSFELSLNRWHPNSDLCDVCVCVVCVVCVGDGMCDVSTCSAISRRSAGSGPGLLCARLFFVMAANSGHAIKSRLFTCMCV